jgi:LuxR family transcriptional regulator, maltose regulon positive regulatory protein
MTTSATVSGPFGHGDPAQSVDSFLEAKLHWPRARPGWVDRDRLLDQFDEATRRPVTLVAAPAGYGKTTLSAQWLAKRRGDRAAAWVSLDAADNDASRLWTHVVTALERAGCAVAAGMPGLMASNSGELIAGVLPKLVNALATADSDVVLILDDFHYVQSEVCRKQVEFLVENLPEQARLVIISRADPGLRLGRLRASGLLAEIRAEHLSFTAEEATLLFGAERVELSAPGVEQVLDRTEGWPAGVYLASLSLSGRTDADDIVRSSTGTDRFVTSYFSEEVLSQGSERVREFIITMSILDRFCAPLCDAVAETTGSADLLDDLERNNLFLVPLDSDRRWFRFHQLFGAVARSELEALHPNRVQKLHERAARWYLTNGHVGEALIHLGAAGLRTEAAQLVQANWLTFVDAGRAPTVLSWMQSLGRNPAAPVPSEEVTAAWMAAIFGDEAGLARHLRTLEEFADLGPLPDGCRSVESAVNLIHTVFGYGGPLEMRAAGERAAALEVDGLLPFYAMARMGLGHAAYVTGELNLAAETLDMASRSEASPAIIRVLALGVQSLTEGELGRLEASRELAERAMGLVDSRNLHPLPQASLAFAALGQVQASMGKLDDAMATLEQGLAMRTRHTAAPWGRIHHLMVMARVAVEAGEISMAQQLLGELTGCLDRFSNGMTAMRARQAVIQGALRERIADGAYEEQLTARELDVLLLLQGSQSIREIGAALYLSSNTVKTHVQSLYRKLGAHSRDEAVANARRDRLI